MTLNLFYDAPEQPEGIFDEFLAIPFFSKDVGVMSFLDLIQVTPSNATGGSRCVNFRTIIRGCSFSLLFSGVFNTVSLTSIDIDSMNVILDEIKVHFVLRFSSKITYKLTCL